MGTKLANSVGPPMVVFPGVTVSWEDCLHVSIAESATWVSRLTPASHMSVVTITSNTWGETRLKKAYMVYHVCLP